MGIQVDPKHVVGRDTLIAHIWTRLDRESVRFTAERRVGKTTVMTKMAAEPVDGFDVLFLEVEGIDSCHRLTELLVNRIEKLLSKKDQARIWFDGFRNLIGGVEIAGLIKLPEAQRNDWREMLDKAIEGLCHHRSDRRILLMFDELPYMLQKVDEVSSKHGSPHEALTLLDTFRELRQRHPNLRMIFAGSVGLHHVLRELRQAKLPSEPFNNMPMIEIDPLEDAHATELASRLLRSERVTFVSDGEESATRRLIQLANNVPFYMERIASQLGRLGRPISQSDVEAAVQRQLTSDHDPWEMEHFRERLKVYYRGQLKDANGDWVSLETIARCILDHFALTNEPQSIDQVWAIVRQQMALTDRQPIVEMLRSLAQDHYLMSDVQKRYSFRFRLIQDWWKTAQGI